MFSNMGVIGFTQFLLHTSARILQLFTTPPLTKKQVFLLLALFFNTTRILVSCFTPPFPFFSPLQSLLTKLDP